MNMANLKFPRVRITVENDDETEREITVQCDNRDAVRFDLTRNRHSWPASEDAPILFLTVIAIFAVWRSDKTLLPDDIDAAIESVLDVSPVDEEGRDVDMGDPAGMVAADPTRAGR